MKDQKKEKWGLIYDTHSSWNKWFNGFDHGVYTAVICGAITAATTAKIGLISVGVMTTYWLGLEMHQGWVGNRDGWAKKKWYAVHKFTRERHQDWTFPVVMGFVSVGVAVMAKKLLGF